MSDNKQPFDKFDLERACNATKSLLTPDDLSGRRPRQPKVCLGGGMSSLRAQIRRQDNLSFPFWTQTPTKVTENNNLTMKNEHFDKSSSRLTSARTYLVFLRPAWSLESALCSVLLFAATARAFRRRQITARTFNQSALCVSQSRRLAPSSPFNMKSLTSWFRHGKFAKPHERRGRRRNVVAEFIRI